MRLVGVVVVASLLAPPAIDDGMADVKLDLKAKDPVAKLPLIAANKQNFLRSFRTWRKGCKRADLWVESGGIEPSADEPQYSTFQLRGGCKEAADEFAGNVPIIEASMKDTKCATAQVRGLSYAKLPASLTVDGMKLDITANASSAHVTVNRFGAVGTLSGGRRMATKVQPLDVRSWYVVDLGTQKQIAILLGMREPDGTVTEKWMEVWAKKVEKPAPVDIAKKWLLALATKDKATLTATSAPTFSRTGFEPANNEVCKKTRAAKKAAELGPVLDCALLEAARYTSLYDEHGFTKIAANKLPVELKSHAKAIAAVASGGTLVTFENNDEKGSTAVLLVVKKDLVHAAFEARVNK